MMNRTGHITALVLLACCGLAQAHDMDSHELYGAAMLDRLEVRNGKTGNSSYWEGQAWLGDDTRKAWFKTQGERSQGKTQTADMQLLYSRALDPNWDGQLGVRHDFSLDGLPARDWAALAFKGVAPYKFDVDGSLYLGNGGAARLKAGYTLLFTQRLALLPEIEANYYGRSDPARHLGSGLSNFDLTLRLRYEISREVAPYLGVSWTNKYGGTAGFVRAAGEPLNDVLYAAGLRLWW